MFYSEYLWTPPGPGTYLISVRAKNAMEQYSPTAEVEVTVVVEAHPKEDLPLLKPTDTPDPNQIGIDEGEPPKPKPSDTPPPFEEEEEEKECIYRAAINLFCRMGTSRDTLERDTFTPGQEAVVIGISEDGNHVQVFSPNFGNACFVPLGSQFGETDGDCEGLPVVKSQDPFPTQTPVEGEPDEPPDEPEEGCTVRQVGGGIICVSPCPAGATPGDACTVSP
jgi:hypothetical protein